MSFCENQKRVSDQVSRLTRLKLAQVPTERLRLTRDRGGGDGENVPQGLDYSTGGDGEQPTSDGEVSRGYVMVLCRWDKLRMLELWRGVVVAVGR